MFSVRREARRAQLVDARRGTVEGFRMVSRLQKTHDGNSHVVGDIPRQSTVRR
jgi:hypothetical protein